jgi:hypothetical protein
LVGKVWGLNGMNREIFLGYETRLCGFSLTKEVNKLGSLSNESKFANFQIHIIVWM